MAVTKILARHARLDVGIKYVLNGDKTEDQMVKDMTEALIATLRRDAHLRQ